MTVTRRGFLQRSAVVGGGLAIGFHLPGCSASPADRWGKKTDLVPNANLRITADDRVVFTLGRVEMGQGTMTSQTMIVAEELDLNPSAIEVELAPNHADFADPEFGMQVTGGSTSTRNAYPILRKVGAMARHALLAAAAIELGVPKAELTVKAKAVHHAPSKRSLGFGDLATKARDHLDEDAPPKPPSAWTVVGKNHVRLDAQSKVDGTAKFGADFDPEGLEVAAIVRGPLGSIPTSVKADAAKAVRGVKEVITSPFGVAVVAGRYHQAKKAAARLEVAWTPSAFSTDALWTRYGAALDSDEGTGNARSDGDAGAALAAASDGLVEAEYRLPYLAHATIEPQTCTASVRKDGCEVWAPTQAPGQCAMVAADITGLSPGEVEVHQTLLGGGFGRRSETDFVAEAVWLSQHRKAPVRVQWSREDDTQHDFYRPASLHRLRAVVVDGDVTAWEHRMVQQSALVRPVKQFMREVMPSALAGAATWAMTTFANDGTIVEGAEHVPYGMPHVSVGYQVAEEPVPVGFWRSVGHSSNGFVVESFIDELAHRAGADPVAFRRERLAEHPRHLGVLDLATTKAGWGGPVPEGRARGVAVHESFQSYVAVVAEVSVTDGDIRVHKLTAAVDCGLAVHPDGVKAQIEGGMIFALGPALKTAEITFEGGRVQQSNFDDFETLRFSEAPEVEVHLVASDVPPSGVGEPGVPPTAAAVANAVFALNGQRLRSLPLRLA